MEHLIVLDDRAGLSAQLRYKAVFIKQISAYLGAAIAEFTEMERAERNRRGAHGPLSAMPEASMRRLYYNDLKVDGIRDKLGLHSNRSTVVVIELLVNRGAAVSYKTIAQAIGVGDIGTRCQSSRRIIQVYLHDIRRCLSCLGINDAIVNK